MASSSSSTAIGGSPGPSSSSTQPAKRSVSFRSSPSTQTISEFSSNDSAMARGPSNNGGGGGGNKNNGSSSAVSGLANSSFTSTSSTSTPSGSTLSTPLKPALKPSPSKLPPTEQYQHTDPLLRRLRLVDSLGKPVNLKSYFRDCKVVALYFSSQWAGMPLKEYQRAITDFQSRHLHEFKVIYVSVDVDEEWYKAGVEGKPWVSMVWNDGSSLPSDRNAASSSMTGGFGSNLTSPQSATHSAQSSGSDDASSTSPPTPNNEAADEYANAPKLYNDEDFLLAGEVDIDASLSLTDTAGTSYLRPYSRVHLASKLDIISAPTLSIYHLPSKRLIERNARLRRIQEGERHETWERWSRGEGAGGLGLRDAFANNKIMLGVSLLSLLYFLLIRVGGESYNVLPSLFEKVAEKTINPLLAQQLRGGAAGGGVGGE